MTHAFYTVKAWCTPARVYIEKAFKPLGIRASYGPSFVVRDKAEGGGWSPPTGQHQTVTVSDDQAEWAAYVLGALAKQVSLQVENLNTDGLKRSFRNGAQRRGVPMPWVYQMNGEKEREEGIGGCIKNLPADEREWAMKDPEVQASIRKGQGFNMLTGVRFTSEKKNRGSTGRHGKKRGKTPPKRNQARVGRPRGSHRGEHRKRER